MRKPDAIKVADPPPSTRISEERLQVWETLLIGAALDPGLVAEIRRYRAMLLGLASRGFAFANGFAGALQRAVCFYCGVHITPQDSEHAHATHCPWPAIEAEVEAIRAEMAKR